MQPLQAKSNPFTHYPTNIAKKVKDEASQTMLGASRQPPSVGTQSSHCMASGRKYVQKFSKPWRQRLNGREVELGKN